MMTATHVTMRNLTRKAEGVGHKLHMDNSSSSTDLVEDLHTRHINCCGSVRKSHKGVFGGRF
jgi:hypothetical protein